MKKTDKYVLLGAMILLVLSSLGVFIFKFVLARPGTTALVSQNGKLIKTIDLSKVHEPYEFTIETDKGHSNTIYVEKNKIKFIKANCPDKRCVKTGFLATTNDIAVCLPHGLLIQIEGTKEGEIDSLAH